MNLRPLPDRVIVEVLPITEYASKAGIIIPENAQQPSQEGIVVATGRNTGKSGIRVKVGDKVLFPRFGGREIEWEDKKYLLLHHKEIVAML
jgi:chaperonin GroES